MIIDPEHIESMYFGQFLEQKFATTAYASSSMYYGKFSYFSNAYCSFVIYSDRFICVPSITKYHANQNFEIKLTGTIIQDVGLRTFIEEIKTEVPLEIFTSGAPVIF